MSIKIAQSYFEQAAIRHQRASSQCDALAQLLRTMEDPDLIAPQIEALAKVMLNFDLCILHRDATRNALAFVQESDDLECLSQDAKHHLEKSLQAALAGSAV